jgi:RNA polymerase sigma factor (sigma-70 family)
MSERYQPIKSDQGTEIRRSVTDAPISPRAVDVRSGRANFLSREDEMRLGQQMESGILTAQKAQLTLKERGDFLTDKQKETIDEEIAGGEKIRIEARDKLVTSHIPLARSFARKYKRGTIEHEDLFQDATEALVRAADRYDWTKGVRFATYAQDVINGGLQHVLRDNNYRPMHMPHGLTENYSSVLKTSGKLVQELQREPTSKEIGERVGKSPHSIETIFEAMWSEKSISYYDGPSESSSIEGAYSVPDPKANTEDTGIVNAMLGVLISKANLDEDSKRVLKHRFYDEWSQAKIGEEIGVSQMQVSRLERGALKKMRELLGPQDSE